MDFQGILYYTGMRCGELLALTPADIDLEKNIIYITKTFHRINKQDIITTPKTTNSIRTITVPNFLSIQLRDYMKRIYGLENSDRLLPIPIHAVRLALKRQCEKSGAKRIRVHDIRHLYVKPMTKNYFLSSNSCNSSMLSRKWHSTGERISSCFFRYLSYSPCAFSRACL